MIAGQHHRAVVEATTDHVVTLTPSSLQTLTDCPLRWLAERHGGADPRDLRSTIGSVLHALIADPSRQRIASCSPHWSGPGQHLPFESRGTPTMNWPGTAP